MLARLAGALDRVPSAHPGIRPRPVPSRVTIGSPACLRGVLGARSRHGRGPVSSSRSPTLDSGPSPHDSDHGRENPLCPWNSSPVDHNAAPTPLPRTATLERHAARGTHPALATAEACVMLLTTRLTQFVLQDRAGHVLPGELAPHATPLSWYQPRTSARSRHPPRILAACRAR